MLVTVADPLPSSLLATRKNLNNIHTTQLDIIECDLSLISTNGVVITRKSIQDCDEVLGDKLLALHLLMYAHRENAKRMIFPRGITNIPPQSTLW